jgi:DNA-binding MarR family transcriptional regulator
MHALAKKPNQSLLRLVCSTRLGYSTVKTIMQRLESDGFVQSKPLGGKVDGRDLYRLSNQGKDIHKQTHKQAKLAAALAQRKIPGLLGGLAQVDVRTQVIPALAPLTAAPQRRIETEIIDMGCASRAKAKVTYG